MDIPHPQNAKAKRIRRILYVGGSIVVLLLITVGLSRLKPAAPAVEGATVYTDVAKRGSMLRNVRGLGPLISKPSINNLFFRPKQTKPWPEKGPALN